MGDGLHRIRDLVEKPALGEAPSNLAVIGRYVLTPEIFGFLRNVSPDGRGEIQLTEGLRALARTQSLYGFQFDGKRCDQSPLPDLSLQPSPMKRRTTAQSNSLTLF